MARVDMLNVHVGDDDDDELILRVKCQHVIIVRCVGPRCPISATILHQHDGMTSTANKLNRTLGLYYYYHYHHHHRP